MKEDKSSWFYKFRSLGFKIASDDDDWFFPEEPHTSRRKEILRKYPEIKKLMGYDPSIAYIVGVEVLLQVFMCWLLQDVSWTWIFIMAYCFGGVLNHSLGSAIHEIGHNLAFGHKRAAMNRLLSLWCNLPLAIPMAVTYKKYHADHHRFMGHETNDVDVPSRLESYLFKNPLTKIIWLFIYPLIQGIRPFAKSPKPVTEWEIANNICQFIFDFIILYVFGAKSLVYLFSGTILGLGCHPLAGHFISEHFLFSKGQATHSYYGPLNIFLFNVGYHNEHHDFPYIPYHRLPEVKRIAAEYYDDLPCHTSWVKVLWDFVFDKNLGPQAHGVGFMKDDETKKSI